MFNATIVNPNLAINGKRCYAVFMPFDVKRKELKEEHIIVTFEEENYPLWCMTYEVKFDEMEII